MTYQKFLKNQLLSSDDHLIPFTNLSTYKYFFPLLRHSFHISVHIGVSHQWIQHWYPPLKYHSPISSQVSPSSFPSRSHDRKKSNSYWRFLWKHSKVTHRACLTLFTWRMNEEQHLLQPYAMCWLQSRHSPFHYFIINAVSGTYSGLLF